MIAAIQLPNDVTMRGWDSDSRDSSFANALPQPPRFVTASVPVDLNRETFSVTLREFALFSNQNSFQDERSEAKQLSPEEMALAIKAHQEEFRAFTMPIGAVIRAATTPATEENQVALAA